MRFNLSNGTLFLFDDNETYEPFVFSRTAQVTLITLYSTSTLLTILGNITVIFVLVLGSKSKTDLAKFLVNLALANLLMAFFCIPYTFTETMLGYWIFGKVMCPVVQYMSLFSVIVGIFTNVALGIDRYEFCLSICLLDLCREMIVQPKNQSQSTQNPQDADKIKI